MIEFLNLLSKDIDENPHQLYLLNSDLLNRILNLTYDIEINLDEELIDDGT